MSNHLTEERGRKGPTGGLRHLMVRRDSSNARLDLGLIFLVRERRVELMVSSVGQLVHLSCRLVRVAPRYVRQIFLLTVLCGICILVREECNVIMSFEHEAVRNVPIRLLLEVLVHAEERCRSDPRCRSPGTGAQGLRGRVCDG